MKQLEQIISISRLNQLDNHPLLKQGQIMGIRPALLGLFLLTIQFIFLWMNAYINFTYISMGILYPIYMTIKAMSKGFLNLHKCWMTYWVIFAVLEICQIMLQISLRTKVSLDYQTIILFLLGLLGQLLLLNISNMLIKLYNKLMKIEQSQQLSFEGKRSFIKFM